jgi:DNA-binding CsgD family transcriptional regulator
MAGGTTARSSDALQRVLLDVYATGLGELDWIDALESLARFFDAPSARVFDVRPATGEVLTGYTFGTQRMEGDYVARMIAIDPRKEYALHRRGCFTSVDYDALPEEDIRRHEFYDWLQRDGGIKYHVGSRMIDADDVSSLVSVNFDARREHARPDEIATFRMLTPHIANAWRVSQRLAQASRIDDLSTLLLESAQRGVVTLDSDGRVLSINRLAHAAIDCGDGLRIERRKLRALRAADDRSLQAEIALALHAARGESFHAGGAVAVGRRGTALPYALRILPMRHVVGPLPDQVPYVAVFVWDPARPPLPSHECVMDILGLTPREAEVALFVAQGLTLAEVAGRMGISLNTARAHLANVMHKTCARNRTVLVSAIRGLPVG